MTTNPLIASPVRLLFKYWWIAVVTTVAVVAASAVLTLQQKPLYQARTSMLLRPDRGLGSVDHQVDSLRMLQPRTIIATYSKFPTSREVRERVEDRMGFDDHEMSAYKIRCSVVPDTFLLNLVVEHEDPQKATDLLPVVFEETKDFAKGVYRIFGLSMLDSGAKPVQIRPQVARSLTVGVVVGLLAGLGLTIVLGSIAERRGARA